MSRKRKILLSSFVGLLTFVGFGAVFVRSLLVRSLAQLEGEATVKSLQEPVAVERDELGVPRIQGASREDCLRALGFVHAQERFFQMDLSRRRSAGELAALVGQAALPADREIRPLRLRAKASVAFAATTKDHADAVKAYTDGVNAGLESLGAKPPEYFLLRLDPEPWRVEDSVLVIYTMFDLLAQDRYYELMRSTMEAALPVELVRFLTPATGRFDEPLVGSRGVDLKPSQIPSSDVVNLRSSRFEEALPVADPSEGTESGFLGEVSRDTLCLGSNNFAISGARSEGGYALLANDMHLPLAIPNVWFRAQLEWPGRRVAGLTLAGVPGLVTGSNGKIAWGFTNASGDFQDWVVVDVDPTDPGRYRWNDGWERFSEESETIGVRGQDPETVRFQSTRWGPVTEIDHDGKPLVLQWTALLPRGVNFGLLDMLDAETLEDGILSASSWRGPPQNVLVADGGGRIGYVLSGYLPKRVGTDGRAPRSWSKLGVGWAGSLDEKDRPRLLDPESGILFSANNRVMDLERSESYGRVWAPSLRASRIAECLRAKDKMNERDLLEIQLDVRSRLHDLYRDIFLEAIAAKPADADLQKMGAVLREWDGTASVDQPAFRLLRELRRRLHTQLLFPLTEPCRSLDPGFRYRWPLAEEPVRRILEERPRHFLPLGFADYPTLLRDVARTLFDHLKTRPPELGLEAPWGRANRLVLRHPFSRISSPLGRLLNIGAVSLPGDSFCVRVQGPTFGASQRFVVSPGREESGILHMPGGQSGHFLSRHYADSQPAWVQGLATPFLGGDATAVLRLIP